MVTGIEILLAKRNHYVVVSCSQGAFAKIAIGRSWVKAMISFVLLPFTLENLPDKSGTAGKTYVWSLTNDPLSLPSTSKPIGFPELLLSVT